MGTTCHEHSDVHIEARDEIRTALEYLGRNPDFAPPTGVLEQHPGVRAPT